MDANDFTNAKTTEVACAVRSLYANIGKCKFKWWEQMVKSETKKKLFVWENEQKVLGGSLPDQYHYCYRFVFVHRMSRCVFFSKRAKKFLGFKFSRKVAHFG